MPAIDWPTKAAIKRVIPDLDPRPYIYATEKNMEFSEADKMFKITVWGPVIVQYGLHKIQFRRSDELVHHEILWRRNCRPHVTIFDNSSGSLEIFNIFLLPPPK
jgi:hypothetical protein